MIEYTYDMAGIRDSKTVDGVEYNYLTLDGKVVRQTWGSNVLDIIYDNSGLPYALKYNGGYYIYVVNQQGDVIRIVNSSGATVAEYRYDAWGNVTYSNGSMAAINPIRYRGYYYDTETGFYYLQSRYYDPAIGRFINADSLASTGQGFIGSNMFTYCLNNPANGSDPCGTCFHRLDFWNDCMECGGETFDQKWDHFSTWCSNSYNTAKDYLSNTDPQVALDGNGISFYKGAPVIHLPFKWTPFSFGVIVIGSQYTSNESGVRMLNHEYGHVQQLKEYGLVSYTCTIAIPSVTCNFLDRAGMLPWTYYSSPWEFEADQLGG